MDNISFFITLFSRKYLFKSLKAGTEKFFPSIASEHVIFHQFNLVAIIFSSALPVIIFLNSTSKNNIKSIFFLNL